MEPDSGLWSAIVAVVGLASLIFTARRGPGSPAGDIPVSAPAEVVEISGQLQVSPAIWQDMQGKIDRLEQKVERLTEVVEESMTRESKLRELLRIAVQALRRANRRLAANNLPEEPVPAELTPHG